MGGDFAPQNVVAGAVDALRCYGKITKIYLVGDQTRLAAELKKPFLQTASSEEGKIRISHPQGCPWLN